MQIQIEKFAKDLGVLPGQVESVLTELGVAYESGKFEADEETLEFVRESLEEAKGSKELVLHKGATPRDIASALGVPQPEIQKTLLTKLKVMATLTTALKEADAEALVKLFGYSVRWGSAAKAEAKPVPKVPKSAPSGAQSRPPVVTVLGHVDHGKTSLLDYIRSANVASKEAGGITQHIGAYQVQLPEGVITFLDTPGHAAFTAMRARGAQVTDIAILVVAADDGLMPQTIEAISHVKNAGVPMIVAVNKMDKPDANPDKVMQQLTEHNVIPQAYGGDVEVVKVSALTGSGIPDLLEVILFQAGLMELKADPKGDLEGVVIEAKIDKGRGPVATVLVQNGTIKVGDAIIVGNTYGRLRAMNDYKGERATTAGPSMPIEILGLEDVPMAGDKVEPADDERSARNVANERADTARIKSLAGPIKRLTLKDLRNQLNAGEIKDLNLIVKADVQGSVEAIRGMLEKIQNEEVNVKVIHSAVGPITESDILLASASDAIVIGFNVKPEGKTKAEAERHKIEIRTYSIIYELIEDIEAAIKGMLAPKFEEQYLGTVEIRVVFNLTRSGMVAGCHVTDGKVLRGANCRVRRDREIVFEGKIDSLKNVKQDVREMIAGQDCGMQFVDWVAFKEGDVVEAYELVQIN
ncbi:MAG: translation initiation factor IF-2 [Armatimonadetes bacterium]|nr:translation initiation factor IF-2 [Armatimonadota bacterium]